MSASLVGSEMCIRDRDGRLARLGHLGANRRRTKPLHLERPTGASGIRPEIQGRAGTVHARAPTR
eukprot:14399076-Alexandrium_andersonii.AAC.1